MPQIITVFGATGNQGGSVINHVLSDLELSKEFKIRAITRDISKPAAQSLSKLGVELREADLNSKSSVADAIKDTHTVFLVTNYWETAQPGVEMMQGKVVADAAREAGVKHIIFSSLLPVAKITGGRLRHVPHFDGKAEIEEYIRTTGVPCTFFLPGYFMSNYSMMLRKGDDETYTLAYPVGKQAKFPLFDAAEDTGKFIKAIIKNREKLLGKQVLGATDYYTPERIIEEFQEVTGKKAKYLQIPAEDYKAALPTVMAVELLENHLFIEDPGYFNGAGLEKSLAILEEKPTTWKEFIKKSNDFN
ncbi:NmrA family transcriptional regulator [Penicillium canescens]|nr:NmrA family transcriptional regulator [Penicillium canescens]